MYVGYLTFDLSGELYHNAESTGGGTVLHLAEDVAVGGDEAHVESEVVLRSVVIERETGLTVGLSLIEHSHGVAGDIGGKRLVVDIDDINLQLYTLDIYINNGWFTV